MKTRYAVYVLLGLMGMGLYIQDLMSSSSDSAGSFRVLTVNVAAHPERVVPDIQAMGLDVVMMQETDGSCESVSKLFGMNYLDGDDQCILSRLALSPEYVTWTGPWRKPQKVSLGNLSLINVRLAMPSLIEHLAGQNWYSEAQRQEQYDSLRRLTENKPTLVCGDMNSFPGELILPDFADAWSSRWTYGATFPATLPVARIDQCWGKGLNVTSANIVRVHSDHRALLVEFSR
jgi:endonuclease/exonuclease/phosphatase (EEP) superfamily protein YafD